MQSQAHSDISGGWKARRDSELVRLYSEQASEQAFAELGRRYANLVYATCLRETGERGLAEDAAQGVFLLLSRKAASLQRCDTLSGWLYSAARYVAKNLIRQERRRQMTETAAMQETALRVSSHNPLWERIEPHFHDALNRLKPAERDAILLRFVQEQSLAEVGSHLGLSENSARMRVTRGLEKIREHLGKAGVTVTVAVLAALLEEHSAHAAPASLSQSLSQMASKPQGGEQNPWLSKAVRSAAWRLFTATYSKPLIALGCGVTFGGMVAGYYLAHPPILTPTEQQRLFTALQGTWQGTLEFADDRTHQHFRYPTNVVFSRGTSGDALQLTATYQGTSSVDTTLFQGNAVTGQFSVRNGGAQSSHKLSSVGKLVRLRDGTYAFNGDDAARRSEVRIRITLNADQATIEEEYRTSAWSRYQFRNRFTLQKQ